MLPGVEPGSRKARKSSSKVPLMAAVVVLLLAAVGGGIWMMSGQKPAALAQSEAARMTEVQQLAADPQPAAPSETKASAETRPEPMPVEALATSPPAAAPPIEAAANKTEPSKIEPPATAAPQAAAPVMPAVPSPKPGPATPVNAPPVFVALAPPSAEQPASDAKLPIPSEEAQSASLKVLKEVYKDEYAQAKQADGKSALAEKMLNESQQSKDDATALYVTLHEARELAVDAVNPALAERAISMLAGRFAIDPLKELAAALDEMTGKPHPLETNRAIVETALARIEEAQSANDFDTAKRLADAAAAAGTARRKTGPVEAGRRSQQIRDRREAAMGRLAEGAGHTRSKRPTTRQPICSWASTCVWCKGIGTRGSSIWPKALTVR